MWNTAVSTLNIIPDIHRLRSTQRVSITMRRKIFCISYGTAHGTNRHETLQNSLRLPEWECKVPCEELRGVPPKMPVLQVKRATKGYWGNTSTRLPKGSPRKKGACTEDDGVQKRRPCSDIWRQTWVASDFVTWEKTKLKWWSLPSSPLHSTSRKWHKES